MLLPYSYHLTTHKAKKLILERLLAFTHTYSRMHERLLDAR